MISALLSKNKEVVGENIQSCTNNVVQFDPTLSLEQCLIVL